MSFFRFVFVQRKLLKKPIDRAKGEDIEMDEFFYAMMGWSENISKTSA